MVETGANRALDSKKYFNRCVFVDQSGRRSTDFIRLAKQQPHLTFDQKFLEPKFMPSTETPFVEITRGSPHEIYPNIIPDDGERCFDGSYEAYLRSILDAIKQHLSRLDPSEFYLFSHSSGYDSRIISGVMAELRDEGAEWLNSTTFHCWGRPEAEGFHEIMDRKGWRNFTITDDSVENPYDLGNPSVSVGGWNSYTSQFRFWGEHDPEKYVLIVGAEGGETFTRPYEKWVHSRGFFSSRGEAMHRLSSIFKGVVAPFLSHEVLRYTMAMPAEWRNVPDRRSSEKRDKLRADLVDMLGLGGIPDPEPPKYNLNLTQSVQDGMLQAYENSKFYKDYKTNIDSRNLFQALSSWDACAWGFGVTVYGQVVTPTC